MENGKQLQVERQHTSHQLSNMGNLVGASADTMSTVVSGTKRFMAGKFPFMIFELPAAAYEMYKTSSPKKRKVVGSLLLAAAVTSMVTGITEPIRIYILICCSSIIRNKLITSRIIIYA